MTTPNGQRHPLQTPRTYVVTLFSKMQGGGNGDLVNLDAGVNGGGEIVSAVHTGTGTYSVTFAKPWSQLLYAPEFSYVDPTASNTLGFDGVVTAIDVTARTATFVFASNTAATDIPSTTTVYITWTVRASNKN